jgi:lipopolysaccharide/colanic/teichoic acid biosynthesis glycosyltransferase
MTMDIQKGKKFLDTHLDRRIEEQHRILSVKKIFITDFILLNTAFFFCNLLKRGEFGLSLTYTKLLFLFYFCWLISASMGNKFKLSSYRAYGPGMLTFLQSALYLIYLMAFMVVVLGVAGFSRLHIFGTCLLLFCLEGMVWSFFNRLYNVRATDRVTFGNILRSLKIEKKISYSLAFMDLCLVVISFFCVSYLKRGSLELLPGYPQLFLIFLGLWFTTSVVTGKFMVTRFKSIHFFSWQWIKAGGLMLTTMAVLIFGVRLFYYSRFQALGPALLLVVLELILVNIYYRKKLIQNGVGEQDVESIDKVKEILKQEGLPLDVNFDIIRHKLMESARENFRKRLTDKDPEIFNFLDTHVVLDDMMRMETAVEKSCELPYLDSDRVPLRFFLNLWKMNDIRRMNAYFLQIHQMLLPGGYYMGYTHTTETHYEWIYGKFPRYIAHFVYVMDFCFNRIMPKLSGVQKLYFSLTKGKGRAISRAELLGRLCFCGFEIVAEKDINQRLYVIGRKAKTSSLDTSPTYGTLIKLKRVGYSGQIINTYKFRTMHPYSEYLQQYVFEKGGGTIDGDGFYNDFRITAWGKIFRKLWIDELPMLMNWLQGDLKIVGIRPLSAHKFSLYTEKMQKLRVTVKPGLVPPFYVDLPQNFEELQKSEERYIERYNKNPIVTDLRYFFLAMWNIFIKHARSK